MAGLWKMNRAKHTAMFSSILRTTILPISLIVALGASAARGVLKADGIIRVMGADLQSAKVTIVPGNAAAYSLPVSSKHITLDLPLDDVYLISVEREGCPTKEVQFDTRVPVDMHASEFQFPFLVTLEHLSQERMFAYNGPVGFVRYDHTLKDFGYETNYVVRVDEDLNQRMKMIKATGVDPKLMAPISSAIAIDRPRGAYSAALGTFESMSSGTVAPNVNEVPRLVHLVSGPRKAEESPVMREAALPVLAPVIPVLRSAPVPGKKPIVAEVAPMLNAAPLVVPKAPSLVRVATAAPSAVGVQEAKAIAPDATDEFSRTDELIKEPRRVTRIVRLTEPTGTVEEYRMVTHAFGAVFYFQDSRSITERDFAQAIAE